MPVTAVRGEGALRMWVCRLPVHIDPAVCTCFLQNCSANLQLPNGPTESSAPTTSLSSPCRGGRLCPPAEYVDFTEIFGEFVTSQRADVGIGPYRTPANPYFPASFERKAFLQQILNRSYSQIWCTVTGGAYHSARRGSMCVRNICKSDSCLNRTAECTKRVQALFSSLSFLLREKR